MYTHEEQALIRLDIFHWLEQKLEDQVALSRVELRTAYSYNGVNIPLIATQQGIHNPPMFSETLAVVSTQKSKYSDLFIDEWMMEYDYESQGTESYNTKLRKAFINRIPIIYLKQVKAGLYQPFINVYVVGDDKSRGKFVLDFRSAGNIEPITGKHEILIPTSEIEKKYSMQQTKRRMHQPAFRAAVLTAYSQQCTICRLQHVSLLDAAHILPDSHELGKPEVPNGLSLCKIHHAAFDKKIIGISPNYKVAVSKPILEEVDGPMLKHGIQEMDGIQLSIPKIPGERPNPDFLDIRFKEFLETA